MNTPRATHIAVCVCTYRRPQGLRRLLESLARQDLAAQPGARISIVIADNEASPATRRLCTTFGQEHGLSPRYIPVTERGISQARNACLEGLPVDTDFIAFVDDDEMPAPRWLDRLLAMQRQTDADVVYGPVVPIFPVDTPAWIRQGDWFHKPRQHATLRDGQEIGFAATCNCLLRGTIVMESGLRFDPAFGLSGGEDKLFFRQIKARGYRIVWSRQAVVRETVPPARARLAYLLKAEYRLGNVRLPVKLKLQSRRRKRLALMGKATYRSLIHCGMAMTDMATGLVQGEKGKTRIMNGALRAAEGLGVLTSLIGIRNRHYR